MDTTDALHDWALYLISVANETRAAASEPAPVAAPAPVASLPPLQDPYAFFVTLTDVLSQSTTAPPTRNGLDAMMDALFAHPETEPLLRSPRNYQEDFDSRDCPPALRDHWTYVLRPAWNQHVDIWRTRVASAEPTQLNVPEQSE
jgi:hypothetical protein